MTVSEHEIVLSLILERQAFGREFPLRMTVIQKARVGAPVSILNQV
jgi:hypothetical protein